MIVDDIVLLRRPQDVTGIKDEALHWFPSHLSDRFQFVHVHNYQSEHKRVGYGVPQGSVVGPILFNIYMLPLGNIIRKRSISLNRYADDSKLYLSIKRDRVDQLVKVETQLIHKMDDAKFLNS